MSETEEPRLREVRKELDVTKLHLACEERRREIAEATFVEEQKQREAAEATLVEEQKQREAAEATLVEEQKQREAAEERILEGQRDYQHVKSWCDDAEDRTLREQTLREAAEGQVLDMQRQRDEAEARILHERLRNAELEIQHESDIRLRNTAEKHALEETRRCEEHAAIRRRIDRNNHKLNLKRREAERRAEASQPLGISDYLDICHMAYLDVKLVPDHSLAAQEHETSPAGLIRPGHIIPWVTFPHQQEDVWDVLSSSPSFSSEATFPPQIQLAYMRTLSRPVTSEIDLQFSERDTVESSVQMLMGRVSNDPKLARRLGLVGKMTFESVTYLGRTKAYDQEPQGEMTLFRQAPIRESRRERAVGKACVYWTSGDSKIPKVAINYKPPHGLVRDEIVAGLRSEIRPKVDVIDQEADGFRPAAKRHIASVITELFSYMVGKGIQYGYICTGDTYVFLRLTDNPADVYYSVCVPSVDVYGDDENCLHRSAIAQVFAFIIQAIRSPPPTQNWQRAAMSRELWPEENECLLRRSLAALRGERCEVTYTPQQWDCFGDFEELSSVQGTSVSTDDTLSIDIQLQGANETAPGTTNQRKKISDQPFCTHNCLAGLRLGSPVDKACPNLTDHGDRHLAFREFLCLVVNQLGAGYGRDDDLELLSKSGSRGAVFKARLTSHKYTLVAKGVEVIDIGLLRFEESKYSFLRGLQGVCIPVCLGLIEIAEPHYFDSGKFKSFMLLSYGGQPVNEELDHINEHSAEEIVATWGKLHDHSLLHRDTDPRHILYDTRDRNFMIVDLSLAEFHMPYSAEQAQQYYSKWEKKEVFPRHWKDIFGIEIESLRVSLSPYVVTPTRRLKGH